MRDNDWYLRDEEDEFGEALHRRTEELYSVPDSIPDQDGLIECPVLPMRDMVVFPRMISPIFISPGPNLDAISHVQQKGGTMIALILKEPDFGTSVTLGAIVFTMLFVGGTRLTHILLTLSACIPLGVWMVMRDPKKFARVLSFLDPWKHGQDVGYQLKQALLAIGSGGLWGLGPGQSRAKLFYLPDCHTDFILAIFSEELGFFGVLLVMALFVIILCRGFRLSLKAPDSFGSYLALGLTLMIGLPALINMGVVSGILPTKGLSLPFLSYGGSGLLVNLLAVGILMSWSRGAWLGAAASALVVVGFRNRRSALLSLFAVLLLGLLIMAVVVLMDWGFGVYVLRYLGITGSRPVLLCDAPGRPDLAPCPDGLFNPAAFPEGARAHIP